MRADLLELLRCPYCGTRLDVYDSEATRPDGDAISDAILACECCHFPVLGGIPVLLLNDTTRRAMDLLGERRHADALHAMLGLEEARAAEFNRLWRCAEPPTYRQLLEVLSPDAEGTYFVYRFSDPTFVMSEGVLRAVAAKGAHRARVIDLCGGSGHLTKVLVDAGVAAPFLADVYFWKLWLAAHFTSPDCIPVCCDANVPLPFADSLFSMVVLADAFPYIWHKRLAAGEMKRISTADGVIAMPHLHTSLGWNYSQGDTLTPAGYGGLLTGKAPRAYRDTALADGLFEHGVVDLSSPVAVDAFGEEPSITLVASNDASVFARHEVPTRLDVTGELRVNPLYRVEVREGGSHLELAFPTPEYEDEFDACKRYLPTSLELPGDCTGVLVPATFGDAYPELRRRRVLLDTPRRYY